MTATHSFLHLIDSSWTLFLDRDGVINKRIPDAYVRNIAEFEFYPIPKLHLVSSGNCFRGF